MIPSTCTACSKPLLLANLYVDDGCPCNSPRGVNFEPIECGVCPRGWPCVKPGHRLYALFGFETGARKPAVESKVTRRSFGGNVDEPRFQAITARPRGFRAVLMPVLLLLFFIAVAAVASR